MEGLGLPHKSNYYLCPSAIVCKNITDCDQHLRYWQWNKYFIILIYIVNGSHSLTIKLKLFTFWHFCYTSLYNTYTCISNLLVLQNRHVAKVSWRKGICPCLTSLYCMHVSLDLGNNCRSISANKKRDDNSEIYRIDQLLRLNDLNDETHILLLKSLTYSV